MNGRSVKKSETVWSEEDVA